MAPSPVPTLPVDPALTLAPLWALDEAGLPVRLGTVWEDTPSVLVFLRHFG